jgi:hypothetical protein
MYWSPLVDNVGPHNYHDSTDQDAVKWDKSFGEESIQPSLKVLSRPNRFGIHGEIYVTRIQFPDVIVESSIEALLPYEICHQIGRAHV